MKFVIIWVSLMAAIAAFSIIYLVGAFAQADFNLTNWDQELRGFIAFTGLCFSCLIFVSSYQLLSEGQ